MLPSVFSHFSQLNDYGSVEKVYGMVVMELAVDKYVYNAYSIGGAQH